MNKNTKFFVPLSSHLQCNACKDSCDSAQTQLKGFALLLIRRNQQNNKDYDVLFVAERHRDGLNLPSEKLEVKDQRKLCRLAVRTAFEELAIVFMDENQTTTNSLFERTFLKDKRLYWFLVGDTSVAVGDLSEIPEQKLFTDFKERRENTSLALKYREIPGIEIRTISVSDGNLVIHRGNLSVNGYGISTMMSLIGSGILKHASWLRTKESAVQTLPVNSIEFKVKLNQSFMEQKWTVVHEMTAEYFKAGISPIDPDFYIMAGVCYRLWSRFDDSLYYLKKANELVPNHPYIQQQLNLAIMKSSIGIWNPTLAASIVEWQWEWGSFSGSSTWVPYSPEEQKQLEQAYNHRLEKIDLGKYTVNFRMILFQTLKDSYFYQVIFFYFKHLLRPFSLVKEANHDATKQRPVRRMEKSHKAAQSVNLSDVTSVQPSSKLGANKATDDISVVIQMIAQKFPLDFLTFENVGKARQLLNELKNLKMADPERQAKSKAYHNCVHPDKQSDNATLITADQAIREEVVIKVN